MSEWFTTEGADETAAGEAQERLLLAWPDAPLANLEVCQMILETAQDQVLAYAPAQPVAVEGEPAPAPSVRLVYAQLSQAKNLWEAGRVSSDGNIGEGGYTFTPRPLDKTIRQIIRPTQGRPHVL